MSKFGLFVSYLRPQLYKIYQTCMLAPQKVDQLTISFRKELRILNIQIKDQSLFTFFWQKVFSEKQITQNLNPVIDQMVPRKDTARFIKYVKDQLQNYLAQQNLVNSEMIGHMRTKRKNHHSRQGQFFIKEEQGNNQGYFAEQVQETTPKNVLFVIVMDKKIEKISLQQKQHSNIIDNQFLVINNKDMYAAALVCSLNFAKLPLQNYILRVQTKPIRMMPTIFHFNKTQIINIQNLNEKVKYSGSKGIVWIQLNITNSVNKLRKFKMALILKIAQYIYKNIFLNSPSHIDQERWSQLRPWWHLLKNNYPRGEQDFQTDRQVLTQLKNDNKQDIIFERYLFLLLQAIYQTKFQLLFTSQFFLNLNPKNYEYPQWINQKQKILEQKYLECFISENISLKTQEAYRINIEYQNEKKQKQIIQNLPPKFFEKLLAQIQHKLISNNSISLAEFVTIYFKFMQRLMSDMDSQKDKKTKKSQIIIKSFQLLLQKCKITFSSKQNQQIIQCCRCFYQLIYNQNNNQVWTIGLANNYWPKFLQIIYSIKCLNMQLAEEIIKSLALNASKLKQIVNNYFIEMFMAVDMLKNKQLTQFFIEVVENSPKSIDNIRHLIKNQNNEVITNFIEFLVNQCQQRIFFKSFVRQIKSFIFQLNQENKCQQLQKMLEYLSKVLQIPENSYDEDFSGKDKTSKHLMKPHIQQDDSVEVTKVKNSNPKVKAQYLTQNSQPSSGFAIQSNQQMRNIKFQNGQQIIADRISGIMQRSNQITKNKYIQRLTMEKKNKKIIKVFAAIYSQEIFEKISRRQKNNNKTIISSQNGYKIHQNVTVSCIYAEEVDLDWIRTDQIIFSSKNRKVISLDTTQFQYLQQRGLFWISFDQITIRQAIQAQFFVLNYLCKLYSSNPNGLDNIRQWFKMIIKKIDRPNQDIFIQESNKFARGMAKENFTFQLVYSFVRVVNELFKQDSSQILQKCDIFKKFSYLKLKRYSFPIYFKNQGDEAKQLVFYKSYFQTLMTVFQNTSTTLSISLLSQFFKKGLEYRNEQFAKQLIQIVIRNRLFNLFLEAEKLLIEFCKNKNIVSLMEFFYIQCLYIKEAIQKISPIDEQQRICQHFNKLFSNLKEKEIIEKYKPKSAAYTSANIVIDRDLIIQNLTQNLFTTTQDEDQIKKTYFIINNPKKFIVFYRGLKKMINNQIYDLVYKLIENEISNLIEQSMKDQATFPQMMKVLLTTPIKDHQHNFIQKFIQGQYCKLDNLVNLIRIYSEAIQQDTKQNQKEVKFSDEQKLEEQGFIKYIIMKLVKLNTELSYQSQQFIKNIQNIIKYLQDNQKGLDIFYRFLDQIFSIIIPKKQNFTKFIRSSIHIISEKFIDIYFSHLCAKFYQYNKNYPLHQDLFYEKIDQAFKPSHPSTEKIYKKIQHLVQNLVKVYSHLSQAKSGNFDQHFKIVWQYLVQKPQLVKYVLLKYSASSQELKQEIMDHILKKQYSNEEIHKIKDNYQRFPQEIQKNLPRQFLGHHCQQVQRIINSMKDLKNIFESYASLATQNRQICSLLNNYKQEKVKNLQNFKEKYGQLSEKSREIKILMTYTTFNQQSVEDSSSLIQQYKKARKDLLQKILSFNKLTVKQFLKIFIQVSYLNIFDAQDQCDQQIRRVQQISRLLNKKFLTLLLQTIKSLLYINLQFQLENKSPRNYDAMKDKLTKALTIINQPSFQDNLSIIQFYKQINQVKAYLDKNFGDNWEKDIRFVILRSIEKHHQLFQLMKKLNLDAEKFKHLKEYNNQIQNSFARADIIQQFKQFKYVYQFWNHLKKNTSEQNLLKSINELIRDKSCNYQKIANFIQNCYKCKEMLKKRIEESSDLSTFFKFEVEAILRHSTFIISLEQDELLFKITYCEKEQQIEVSYAKLNLYKQKCMLLFESSQNSENDEQNSQFKQFCQLFELIKQIKKQCGQLQSYGYDAKLLTTQIQIVSLKNQDQMDKIVINYQQIKQLMHSLQKLKLNWVQQIKYICSQSFVLTHYIGSNLAKFVNSLINDQMPKSLKSILYRTQQELDVLKKKPENQVLLVALKQGNLSPIDKVKYIKKIFETYDSKVMMEEKNQPNPITLITSTKNYFYSHILRQNKNSLPKPNQIFFCHENTIFQQLQYFLYRALIKTNNHYIIETHKLAENVKHLFCQLLLRIKINQRSDFNNANLFFIDNDSMNTVYLYLCKPKAFKIAKKFTFQNSLKEQLENANQNLVCLIPSTQIICSTKAGLGKTYQIESYARSKNFKIHHFTIAGNINFMSLGRRLKSIEFDGKQVLLLKIGFVLQKERLEIFLASLIILRCFFAQEYLYLHQNTEIFIQLENIFQPSHKTLKQGHEQVDLGYVILNILYRNNFYRNNFFIKISKFDSYAIDFNMNKIEDQFVFKYLELFQTKEINNVNLKLEELTPSDYLKSQKKVHLIEKYFVQHLRRNNLQPTFILYSHIMKLWFNMFDTFTKSQFFSPWLLQISNKQNPLDNLNYKEYRYNFIQVCLSNSLRLLQQTYTENSFDQNLNRDRTFREMSKNYQILIMPEYSKNCYHFAYFKDQLVPFAIKVYNIIQNIEIQKKNLVYRGTSKQQFQRIFSEYCSLKNIKDEVKLQNIMHQILKATTSKQKSELGQVRTQIQNNFSNNYVLTRDNFFKMCMIIQRERSNIPSIIQGESGVGKTALVTYLSEVYYQTKPLIYNIHAGYHQKEISRIVDQILQRSRYLSQMTSFMEDQNQIKHKKIIVFFDEFNTTDQVSYLKEIIIEHKYMGQKLPNNIYFIAACNPYRYKKQSPKMITGGLKHKPITHNNSTQMAFMVNPPPLSMIQLMWDYQQLTLQENRLYIQKILKNIDFSKKDEIVNVMLKMHEHIKQKVEVSAVSLRDVERFSQLFVWLNQYLNEIKKTESKRETRSDYRNQIPMVQKAAALALYFCYCLRFPSQEQRKQNIKLIQNEMNWHCGFIAKVVYEVQTQFVKNLKKPENIAQNLALKQNTFTSFVCLMKKIPILIIGNPGSSKSLSVNLLASNLNGTQSNKEIFKKYPEINMNYFQGSQSSTSKGVEEVFNKAQRQIGSNNSCLNCIYFDEIGLAEKSVHNPLKVLHSKLQIHGQRLVSFIGISNYQLDAAKMSRFLILSRPPPSINQLKETAKFISQSYNNVQKQAKQEKKIQQMGEIYYHFIKQWQLGQNNRKGFFGLRDFYNYVKYVCKNISPSVSTQELIQKAIRVNFDGQRNSLELFYSCYLQSLKIKNINLQFKQINPVDLVMDNLQNKDSRCLLLIVKGDALIPIIEQSIRSKDRKFTLICGSIFPEDEKSQDYNLQVTQKVISSMNKGEIVAFKDINNSIQSSLYDLFNKSYYMCGNKTYCRIAVGANSNPICPVDPKFNAIVFMEESKARTLDLPFLNRFQKHYLQAESILNSSQKTLTENILRIIKQQFLNKDRLGKSVLKANNYLFNISQESIITLILKQRNNQNYKQKQMAIIRKILQNSTLDFKLLSLKQHSGNYLEYLYEQSYMRHNQDCIIYTYDQYIDYTDTTFCQMMLQGSKIRISEMKSEKQLKQELTKSLNDKHYNRCIVILECPKLIEASLKRVNQRNYDEQFQQKRHLQLIQQLLFLCKKIKCQNSSKTQILIFIQLQRSSFLKHQHFQLNISFLHDFQQKFKERMDKDQNQYLFNLNTYQNLFQKFELNRKLRELFNDAILTTKLKSSDDSVNIKKVFHLVTSLEQNQQVMDNVEDFLTCCLENDQFHIQTLHSDRQLLDFCSDTYQALEKLTAKRVTKYIVIFIRTLVTGNYFKLFSQMQIQESADSRREQIERKIRIKYFKKELQELKKKINNKQNIMQLEKISLQKESNQVIINSHSLLFKEVKHFISAITQMRNKKSTIIAIEQEGQQIRNPKYVLFRQNFENLLLDAKYSRLSKYFQDKDQQQLIIKDIISCKFSNKKTSEINFIVRLFQQIIKGNQIMKIFVLIGQQNQMFSIFISLLDVFLKHIKDLNTLMDLIYSPGQLKEQFSIEEQGEYFLQIVMRLSIETIKLNRQNIQMLQGPKNFYKFFKELSSKIIQQGQYIESMFIMPSEFYLLKSFYQLFQSSQGSSKQQSLIQFINFQSQASIYQRIQHFVTKAIQKDQKLKQRYQSFLSCNFFENWASVCLSKQGYSSQLENCIKKFVQWTQKSSIFANKSSRFFQQIIKFQDQAVKIESILQGIKRQQSITIINQLIVSHTSFELSLNNYFCKRILQIFYKARRQSQNLLQVFFQPFQTFLLSQIDVLTVQGTFILAFIKIYLSQYQKQLMAGEQVQITKRIDVLLQYQVSLVVYARLFLVKRILNNYSLQSIHKNFFECNRCDWIKSEKLLFEEKKSIRTANFDSFKYLAEPIEKFEQSQFGNKQFKALINGGLKNTFTIYELLSYFLFKVCYQLDQHYRTNIKTLIQNNQELNHQSSNLVKRILLCYARGYILRSMRTGQRELQQYYLSQVHLCNYFNIVVATQYEKNPLAEMFFKDSKVQNLSKQLSQKFCIGNLPHPGVAKIDFFLKRHKDNFRANNYIKCSQTCDYYVPVGGNFYGVNDNCKNPIDVRKCPYCGKLVGGNNHRKVQLMKDNILIEPHKLEQQIQKLSTINFSYYNQIQRKEKIQLTGLVKISNTKRLQNHFKKKMNMLDLINQGFQTEIPFVHQYVLQSIIYFISLFIIQNQLVNQQQIHSCFGLSAKDCLQLFPQLISCCQNLICKEAKILQDDLPFWSIAAGQCILSQILNYSKGTSTRQYKGLKSSYERDYFTEQIKKCLMTIAFNPVEKQKKIHEKIIIKEINLSQILKQRGDQSKIEKSYKYIRLFKNINDIGCDQDDFVQAIYKYLKKQYSISINNQHPLLKFFLDIHRKDQAINVFELIQNIKQILLFISKIKKLCNLKIQRIQKKNLRVQKFIKDYARNKEQCQKLTKQFSKYVKVWNRFRKNKEIFDLQFDCNSYSNVPQIDQKDFLNILLLVQDQKQFKNTEGESLTAFICSLAKIYNQIVTNLINTIKKVFPNSILCQQFRETIDPTEITYQSKILQMPSEDYLKNAVKLYSNYSVQFGVSNLQFFFEDIQFSLIKNIKPFVLLKQDKSQFKYVQYIGDHTHFLAQLKLRDDNLSLKQINKQALIEDYFKEKKLAKVQKFHRFIKEMQISLEIALVYYKNTNINETNCNLLDFIQRNRIPKIIKQLREEPFKKLPLKVLVDLYQYVESLNFENIDKLLSEDYKNKKLKGKMQSNLDRAIIQMKQEKRSQGTPSFQNFKKALYRFISRKVLAQCIRNNQTIKQNLFWRYYWNKDEQTGQYIEQFSCEFMEALDIKLQYLQAVLNKVPFIQENDKVQRNPIQTKPKLSTKYM